jgi:sugar phosphate isomerase/epimerase
MNRGRLRYGFSTLGCPQASWEEILGLAAEGGFEGVELRMLAGEMNLAAALENRFGNPEQLADEVKRAGIEILALDSSQCLLADEGWTEVRELARWADRLGVPWIRIFDGCDGEDGLFGPEQRKKSVDRLADWNARKDRFGISCDVMIETHSSLTRVEDCRLLAEDLADRGLTLNLLWDVFHTWKKGARDLGDTWSALKPWTRHIHLKDGSEDGSRLTLPGEGGVPMVALLENLRTETSIPPVSLEWEAHWDKTLPPLEEAIRSGRRHGWW